MDKKDDRIVIRISTQDKMRMKMMALEKDMTVSDFVLYAVMKQIAEEEEEQLRFK